MISSGMASEHSQIPHLVDIFPRNWSVANTVLAAPKSSFSSRAGPGRSRTPRSGAAGVVGACSGVGGCVKDGGRGPVLPELPAPVSHSATAAAASARGVGTPGTHPPPEDRRLKELGTRFW